MKEKKLFRRRLLLILFFFFVVFRSFCGCFKERETTFFEGKKVSEKSKRRWKRAVNKVILINKVLKSFKNFPIKLVNVKSNEEKVTLLNKKDVLFFWPKI